METGNHIRQKTVKRYIERDITMADGDRHLQNFSYFRLGHRIKETRNVKQNRYYRQLRYNVKETRNG